MDLSESQKESVQKWAAEGASIARIQDLLKEEFSIGMTYMDVRFLVDDLGVVYSNAAESPEATEEEASPEVDLSDEVPSPSGVSVEVDAVIRPGSLVSGTVRFSDGVSLGWQLTSTGQLGLIPGDDPEYRPSNEDIQSFQSQLQSVLKEKGF